MVVFGALSKHTSTIKFEIPSHSNAVVNENVFNPKATLIFCGEKTFVKPVCHEVMDEYSYNPLK